MSGFDVKQQVEAAREEDKGTVVEIFGIDEKPMYYDDGPGTETKPVTITVAGVHSRLYRRVDEKLRRRKLRPNKLTGEAIYDDNIERVVACTLDWAGFHAAGDPLPCTRENATMLYKQCPWVLDQVLEAMNDHSRFFSNGSVSPTSTSEQKHD